MTSTAEISECGRYRYELVRRWGPGPLLVFVMLNPSTADAMLDDPTIRRCVGFAQALGYAGIRVVNLYALRATHPAMLRLVEDPVGPDNDEWLIEAFRHALDDDALVIAAWGALLKAAGRAEQVVELARAEGVQLHALSVTKLGAPGHPLYLPASSTPVPWPTETAPVVPLHRPRTGTVAP